MTINQTEIERVFNKVLQIDPSMARVLGGNQADYRYYSHKGSKDRYFYTVQKITHKSGKKYVAGVYRFIKSKDSYKLVRKAGFGKKRTAIERAGQWAKEGR